jgi:hypothetical protein
LSNQTFLYSTTGPEKPLFGACPAAGRLLMAEISIPVFWYMLYDESSLVLGPQKDRADRQYLHLTTPTTEGLARAEGRWPEVSRVLGGRPVTALFQAWMAFLRAKANAHVHCETIEWFWMFDSHDAFEEQLRTCLAAFDHIPKVKKTGVELNEWWGTLLAQAHVGTRGGRLNPLGNLSYCGFAYHHAVPWSEDADDPCGTLARAEGESGAGAEE